MPKALPQLKYMLGPQSPDVGTPVKPKYILNGFHGPSGYMLMLGVDLLIGKPRPLSLS